jgi:hypothetical protein
MEWTIRTNLALHRLIGSPEQHMNSYTKIYGIYHLEC